MEEGDDCDFGSMTAESSTILMQHDACSQFCWLLNKALHEVQMLRMKLVHDIDNLMSNLHKLR